MATVAKETRAQARREQPQGAARLPHRGHLRGGPRAHGHRGQVAAQGRASLVDGFAIDPRRRAVAGGRAHPRVPQGHLDQPRRPAPAQAAAAQARDRQADHQDPRERAHDRAARRCTSRTAGPRSRSRSPRARSTTTSGRRCASGRTGARPSGPCRPDGERRRRMRAAGRREERCAPWPRWCWRWAPLLGLLRGRLAGSAADGERIVLVRGRRTDVQAQEQVDAAHLSPRH